MTFLRLWRKPPADNEGAHARARAEASLEQARAQRPAVDKISDSLRGLSEENHFVDRITNLIRGA